MDTHTYTRDNYSNPRCAGAHRGLKIQTIVKHAMQDPADGGILEKINKNQTLYKNVVRCSNGTTKVS